VQTEIEMGGKTLKRELQGSFTPPENSTSLMPSDIAAFLNGEKEKLSLFAIDKDLFFT
jgi:hypothetical protein